MLGEITGCVVGEENKANLFHGLRRNILKTPPSLIACMNTEVLKS
jgi:hypothetical protein